MVVFMVNYDAFVPTIRPRAIEDHPSQTFPSQRSLDLFLKLRIDFQLQLDCRRHCLPYAVDIESTLTLAAPPAKFCQLGVHQLDDLKAVKDVFRLRKVFQYRRVVSTGHVRRDRLDFRVRAVNPFQKGLSAFSPFPFPTKTIAPVSQWITTVRN